MPWTDRSRYQKKFNRITKTLGLNASLSRANRIGSTSPLPEGQEQGDDVTFEKGRPFISLHSQRKLNQQSPTPVPEDNSLIKPQFRSIRASGIDNLKKASDMFLSEHEPATMHRGPSNF